MGDALPVQDCNGDPTFVPGSCPWLCWRLSSCSGSNWTDVAAAVAAAPGCTRFLALPLLAVGSAAAAGIGGSGDGGGGASCFGALLLGLSGPELTRPTLKLGLLLADELGRRHHMQLQDLSQGVSSVLLYRWPGAPPPPSGSRVELGEVFSWVVLPPAWAKCEGLRPVVTVQTLLWWWCCCCCCRQGCDETQLCSPSAASLVPCPCQKQPRPTATAAMKGGMRGSLGSGGGGGGRTERWNGERRTRTRRRRRGRGGSGGDGQGCRCGGAWTPCCSASVTPSARSASRPGTLAA